MYAEFLFGNGWTWLIRNEEGKLQIINTTNGSSPTHHYSLIKKDPISIPSLLGSKIYQRVPLLCLNLRQHAYLPDYAVHKNDYVSKFLKFVDWERVHSYCDYPVREQAGATNTAEEKQSIIEKIVNLKA